MTRLRRLFLLSVSTPVAVSENFRKEKLGGVLTERVGDALNEVLSKGDFAGGDPTEVALGVASGLT